MNTLKELIAIENFANKFDLKVKLFLEQDKRKKTKFILRYRDTSVSPPLNYNEMNHFLLGIDSCKKYEL